MANKFSGWLQRLAFWKKKPSNEDESAAASKGTRRTRQKEPSSEQPFRSKESWPARTLQKADQVSGGNFFSRAKDGYRRIAGRVKDGFGTAYKSVVSGAQESWEAIRAEEPKPLSIGAVLQKEKEEIEKSRSNRLGDLKDKQSRQAEVDKIINSFGPPSGNKPEVDGDGSKGSTGTPREAKAPPGRNLPNPIKNPVENDFVGLCFSGGGIRSATFNLGVTTGLAKQKYLKQIDYLSTVSGGGYIGSWLTAWIKRKGCAEVEGRLNGSLGKVATEKPKGESIAYSRYQEPDPVRFLRRFSNYLAPRSGLLSTDLWALVAVYLRNVMLNLTLLIAAGAFVLTLPLLGMHLGWEYVGRDLNGTLTFVMLALLVVAMASIAYSFASFSSDVKPTFKLAKWIVSRPGWWVVAPLLVASGCLTYVVTPSLVDRLPCIDIYLRPPQLQGPGWLLSHLPGPVSNSFAFRWITQDLPHWISGLSLYRWLSTLPVILRHKEMWRWVLKGAFFYTFIWLLGHVAAQFFEIVALWRSPDFKKKLKGIWPKLRELARVFWGNGHGPQPVKGGRGFSLIATLISGALGGLLLYGFGELLKEMPGALWPQVARPRGIVPFYGHAALWTVLGPPLLLWTAALVSVLHVGLLGRTFPDAKREWLSRLCAMLALTALAWAVVMGLSLYGAVIFKFLFLSTWAQSTWGRILKWIVAGGWLTATAGGVIGGNMSKSAPQKGNGTTGIMLKLAPGVFILGLLLLLSFGVDWYLRTTPVSGDSTAASAATVEQYNSIINKAKDAGSVGEFVARFAELTRKAAPSSAFAAMDEANASHWAYADQYLSRSSNDVPILLAVLAMVVWVLAWRLDVNEFSIHLLYRNRLARCYLGASRDGMEREPQAFTGFDVNDDIPLATLRTNPSVFNPDLTTREVYKRWKRTKVYRWFKAKFDRKRFDRQTELLKRKYYGPYHILCTALNLVSGKELAWQNRKARSFIYSPLYCGYDYFRLDEPTKKDNAKTDGTGDPSQESDSLEPRAYRPTQWYSGDAGPYLGTALAISGAAATPNMGYHSSPALTFLMAVFNVRLGWWAGNTRHKTKWRKFGPNLALYLGLELFGRTNDEKGFVYLSDGGHFENLGLYELVRRKCRYIIASDGGADSDYSFGDLGNAMQKCRRDLGAEIKIDVSKLRPKKDEKQKDERLSDAHYAFGRITYHDGSEGSLLYLKSSLTKSDRQDIQSFATGHPAFPHDSTADQFFDEDRFESYRALGEDVFKAVMNDVEKELKERGFTAAMQMFQSGVQLGPTPNSVPGEPAPPLEQTDKGQETKDQPQVTASSGAAAQLAKQEPGQVPKFPEQPPGKTSQAKTDETKEPPEPSSAPMTVAGLFTALEQIYSNKRPAQKTSFTLEEVDVARMRFSYQTE